MMELQVDRLRQAVNVVTAIAMPVASYLVIALGTDFGEATETATGRHPVIPAGYAFSIWGPIYAGCLGYAMLQALPSRRTDPLFRRIGWATASAFLATVVWLGFASVGFTWWTVACILWIAVPLAFAFVPILRRLPTLTWTERALVSFPIGLFAGWITVAVFANYASTMKEYGWSNLGLSEVTQTVGMIAVATLLGGFVAARFEAIGYPAAIVWALYAIMAQLGKSKGLSIFMPASTAACFGVVVIPVCLVIGLVRKAKWLRDA